jgi:hypothetical protein
MQPPPLRAFVVHPAALQGERVRMSSIRRRTILPMSKEQAKFLKCEGDVGCRLQIEISRAELLPRVVWAGVGSTPWA